MRLIALALLLVAACKAAEPAGDPLLASNAKACVDAKSRVTVATTWEQTTEGLALRMEVKARPEAKDARLDGEPRLSGNGTLVPRTVAQREVIVDVVVSPMTGHIELLIPNQPCEGGKESGSIRVIATWQGAASLKPPVEIKLASTGRQLP